MATQIDDPIEAATKALAELRDDLLFARLQLLLKRFNPDQPRWPAGQSDGGQ